MMVCDQHAYKCLKVELLDRTIRSPILEIVPGVRTRQIDRFAASIGEVVGIGGKRLQGNLDRSGQCQATGRDEQNQGGEYNAPAADNRCGVHFCPPTANANRGTSSISALSSGSSKWMTTRTTSGMIAHFLLESRV